MDIPDDPKQIRRMLDAHLKQLTPRGPVLAASVVHSARRCGHFGCKCNRGEKHTRTHITYREDGKTRSLHIPADLVDDVQQWAAEARRLKRLLRECSQLNIALIRSDRRRPS